MKIPVLCLTSICFLATANAAEQKFFRITLAGRVKDPAHVDVTASDRISEVIKKAGGIDVFGVRYRFYRVRIIDLNATERAEAPNAPPDQKEIKKVVFNKDADPTISELDIHAGDILIFDQKRLF